MAESFFDLSKEDQREALEYARAQSGRPAHLLEKDIWVVWALRALFESPIANDLTFKGGTSLSKIYKIIDRFSEDIDLTYDIRKLIPDLLGEDGELPASRSQANKWTKAVRNRLPDWITNEVLPVIQQALKRDHLEAQVELSGQDNDKLLLRYPALMQGTGYVAPVITLEFGGRATGWFMQMLFLSPARPLMISTKKPLLPALRAVMVSRLSLRDNLCRSCYKTWGWAMGRNLT